MKVLVTITTYNEEKNIEKVLREIPDNYDVLVVDDGSVDGTVDIVKKFRHKIAIHQLNLGQGTAVITSFKIGIIENYDILIEMDGDGQHDPQEIPKFVEVLSKTTDDIVVGSRLLGNNHQDAPFLRRTFLPYFTWVFNKITGYKLTDSMCGFRAFRVNSLKKTISELENMFEPQYLAAEMFIRFSKAGLTVTEIPITLGNRLSGNSSKGLFRYGMGVSRAILKSFLDT